MYPLEYKSLIFTLVLSGVSCEILFFEQIKVIAYF